MKKIHCTKLGDFVFDKLLGLNSNCYERKKKIVINPSVENLGTRYLYVENKKIVKCPHQFNDYYSKWTINFIIIF